MPQAETLHPNDAVAVAENLPAITEKPLIQQMLESAKDVDVEKLKVLVAMHEHAQDREAEKRYAVDFIRMKSALPKIVRLKDNTQTRSKYAPLEDINAGIDKILEEHGFGTMHKIIETNAEGVKVNVRLWHKDGHFEEVPIWMPLDDKGMQGTKNKTIPHAIASSVMYARRVGQCALLNISTGDSDGNLDHSTITDEQALEIKNALRDTESDVVKFLAYMKVESVDEIPARDYQKATAMLESKKKQKEKLNHQPKGADQ